jgi:hypothetical protein
MCVVALPEFTLFLLRQAARPSAVLSDLMVLLDSGLTSYFFMCFYTAVNRSFEMSKIIHLLEKFRAEPSGKLRSL